MATIKDLDLQIDKIQMMKDKLSADVQKLQNQILAERKRKPTIKDPNQIAAIDKKITDLQQKIYTITGKIPSDPVTEDVVSGMRSDTIMKGEYPSEVPDDPDESDKDKEHPKGNNFWKKLRPDNFDINTYNKIYDFVDGK